MLIVQQVAMIGGSERLLKARRTIFADPQQAIGETTVSLAMQAFETFTDSLRDGPGQRFAGELRQFLDEPIGFIVLDIKGHFIPFYLKYRRNTYDLKGLIKMSRRQGGNHAVALAGNAHCPNGQKRTVGLLGSKYPRLWLCLLGWKMLA